MSDENLLAECYQIAAQCWCDEDTSATEMNTALAFAFAKRLLPLKARVAELEAEFLGSEEEDACMPPLGEYSYALQWAADTLSGRMDNRPHKWGTRNLAKVFFVLTRRVAELEAAQAWRPIKSRPRDERWVLVANSEDVEYAYYSRVCGWYTLCGPLHFKPKVWHTVSKPPNTLKGIKEQST